MKLHGWIIDEAVPRSAWDWLSAAFIGAACGGGLVWLVVQRCA